MPNPISEYGIENSTTFSVKSFNIYIFKMYTYVYLGKIFKNEIYYFFIWIKYEKDNNGYLVDYFCMKQKMMLDNVEIFSFH
jgi:hypothetical protein